MLAGARAMLELAGLTEELPPDKATLTADCNYHSEENLKACEEAQVDAYIPGQPLPAARPALRQPGAA